jgi:Uma2 family endonuclease
MIDQGILRSGDRVEFLDGLMVAKMTRNPPHRIALAHLRDLLIKLAGPDWHVECQAAITLDTSEPEPDIAVVRGQVDDYPDRHPGPMDLALVVEVADSTLATDRDFKKRIYARAEIAQYWIVNLVERQIEVYTEPTGAIAIPDYIQRVVYTPGQDIRVKLCGTNAGSVAVRCIAKVVRHCTTDYFLKTKTRRS